MWWLVGLEDCPSALTPGKGFEEELVGVQVRGRRAPPQGAVFSRDSGSLSAAE